MSQELDPQLVRAVDSALQNAIRSKEVQLALRETIRNEFNNAFTEHNLRLGINTGDPLGHQADQMFLRSLRLSTVAVKTKAWMTMAALLVTGVAALIWMALRGGN